MIIHYKLLPDLSDEGLLRELVLEQLKKRSIPLEGLVYRVFDPMRISIMLRTGTDRDEESNVRYLEEEDQAMKKAGLYNPRQVTFVSPLRYLPHLRTTKDVPYALAIYDGTQLEQLLPNGFSRFKNPLGQYPALQAVFKKGIPDKEIFKAEVQY